MLYCLALSESKASLPPQKKKKKKAPFAPLFQPCIRTQTISRESTQGSAGAQWAESNAPVTLFRNKVADAEKVPVLQRERGASLESTSARARPKKGKPSLEKGILMWCHRVRRLHY